MCFHRVVEVEVAIDRIRFKDKPREVSRFLAEGNTEHGYPFTIQGGFSRRQRAAPDCKPIFQQFGLKLRRAVVLWKSAIRHRPNRHRRHFDGTGISTQCTRAAAAGTVATAAVAQTFGNPDQPPQGAINTTGNPSSFTDPGPQNPAIASQFPAISRPRRPSPPHWSPCTPAACARCIVIRTPTNGSTTSPDRAR